MKASKAGRIWVILVCLVLSITFSLSLNHTLAETSISTGLGTGVLNDNLFRITYGQSPSENSTAPSISFDGTKVAFESLADLLDEGHDVRSEIWLYDAASNELTRVTYSQSPGAAFDPSISADGNKIAFSSDYNFVTDQAQDGNFEVWIYDTNSKTITRAATMPDFSNAVNQPSINSDGSRIAFRSNTDLFSGTFTGLEIWLYDSGTMTATRLTNSGDVLRNSVEPAINADGTIIAFSSDADFLSEGILDDQQEIWYYSTNTLTVTRITTATDNLRDSVQPSVSADGTKIVFASNSDLLNEGIPSNQSEIWLYDTTTATLTRITTAVPNGRDSTDPSISADGTKIAFRSDSDFLGEGIPELGYEMWLYDISSDTYSRITYRPASGGSNLQPALSGNGEMVAFQSSANYHDSCAPTTGEIWLASPTNPTINLSHQIFLPIVVKSGTTTSTPVVWEDDDFDALTLGALAGQSGWSLAAPDRSSPVVIADSPGNILEIDAGSSETIVVDKSVLSQTTGIHELSFRVRVTGGIVPSMAKIEVRPTSGVGWDKLFQIYFGDSMRINYGPAPGQAFTFVCATQMDTWYDILVRIDLDNQLASVWVDSNLAAQNIPIYPGSITNLGISGWDFPGSVHLDDLLGIKP
ncbi:TolB family protein [Candidatus Leptofilum sp.]|uniref:TolB family protein n=1 Tax=Candidatus Leptofilum sp. TaxID=3241576 RepID=UPI003B5BE59B